MTIKDASAILFGTDAATRYLNLRPAPRFTQLFPVIQASLDEVNARTYWKTVVDAYNKNPVPEKKLNPQLDDHVNNKAFWDGLFSLIQVKEEGIRTDVGQRTSPLLQEVFGEAEVTGTEHRVSEHQITGCSVARCSAARCSDTRLLAK